MRALFTDRWIVLAALGYVAATGAALLISVAAFRQAVIPCFVAYALFAIWRACLVSKNE
jgi:hypothetical protein